VDEEKEMTQIKDELTSIVRDIRPTVTLTDNKDYDRPLNEIGIDSLDAMTILLGVEEKYGLDEIPDEEYEKLTTLNLIVVYIEKTLAEKEGG